MPRFWDIWTIALLKWHWVEFLLLDSLRGWNRSLLWSIMSIDRRVSLQNGKCDLFFQPLSSFFLPSLLFPFELITFPRYFRWKMPSYLTVKSSTLGLKRLFPKALRERIGREIKRPEWGKEEIFSVAFIQGFCLEITPAALSSVTELILSLIYTWFYKEC